MTLRQSAMNLALQLFQPHQLEPLIFASGCGSLQSAGQTTIISCMNRTEQETTRTCAKCGDQKSLTEFYQEKRGRNGHRYSCKACDHKRKVLYLTGLTLEEHERQKKLRSKHKMTEREYSHRWRRKHLAMALIGHARTRHDGWGFRSI